MLAGRGFREVEEFPEFPAAVEAGEAGGGGFVGAQPEAAGVEQRREPAGRVGIDPEGPARAAGGGLAGPDADLDAAGVRVLVPAVDRVPRAVGRGDAGFGAGRGAAGAGGARAGPGAAAIAALAVVGLAVVGSREQWLRVTRWQRPARTRRSTARRVGSARDSGASRL